MRGDMMVGKDNLDLAALTQLMPLLDKKALAVKVFDTVLEKSIKEEFRQLPAFWDDVDATVGKLDGVFDALDALMSLSDKYAIRKPAGDVGRAVEQWRGLCQQLKVVAAERRAQYLRGAA